MSPRNLLNLALAGIAVCLGLIAYYRPGLEPATAPQPITTLDAAQVRLIEVSRRERPALTFTRQDGGWLLGGDPPLPASPFQLNSLLAILHAEARREYPADTLDLRQLGLDPPEASIRIDDVPTLEIGTTEPLDNLRYVRHGATVYLLEDSYQHLINADRSNFVARRLLEEHAVITRLALPELTLAQNEAGHWELHPENPAVSADAIQQLLSGWQQARALYVRPWRQETSGAGITVQLAGGGKPLDFILLSRSPEFILARPDLGIEYHFSKDTEKQLLEIGTIPPATTDGTPAAD